MHNRNFVPLQASAIWNRKRNAAHRIQFPGIYINKDSFICKRYQAAIQKAVMQDISDRYLAELIKWLYVLSLF